MAPRIQDFVEETANAPGNASSFPLIKVTGAIRCYDAFSTDEFFAAMDDGQSLRQVVRTKAARVNGVDSLTILEVLWTINRDTVALSFPGLVRIFCWLPASRTPVLEASGTLGEAYLPYRAAWREIGQPITLTGTVGLVDFSLPAGFRRFRLEFQNAIPPAAAAMFMRLDVGTGFLQASNSYGPSTLAVYNGGVVPSTGALSGEILLAPVGVENVMGFVEFSAASAVERCQRIFQTTSVVTPNAYRAASMGGFQVIAGGTARAIRLGFVNQNVGSGTFRLLGVQG